MPKNVITDADNLCVHLMAVARSEGYPEAGPAWIFLKFLADTQPPERQALLYLLGFFPDGGKLRYRELSRGGEFRGEVRGVSFRLKSHDYSRDDLEKWFIITTDGGWEDILSKAQS